jgi:hypothetical protein
MAFRALNPKWCDIEITKFLKENFVDYSLFPRLSEWKKVSTPAAKVASNPKELNQI